MADEFAEPKSPKSSEALAKKQQHTKARKREREKAQHSHISHLIPRQSRGKHLWNELLKA